MKKMGTLRKFIILKHVSRRINRIIIKQKVGVNQTENNMLNRQERKILRAIFGGKNTKIGERWTNQALKMLYRESCIKTHIKTEMLRLGTMERMTKEKCENLSRIENQLEREQKAEEKIIPESCVESTNKKLAEERKNRRLWRKIVLQFTNKINKM